MIRALKIGCGVPHDSIRERELEIAGASENRVLRVNTRAPANCGIFSREQNAQNEKLRVFIARNLHNR